MRTGITTTVSAAALALTALVAQAGSFKEGKWLFTTNIKAAGESLLSQEDMEEMKNSGMKLPGISAGDDGSMSMKYKKCMTAQDMLPPQHEEPDTSCTVTEQKVTGSRIEYVSHCKGKGTDITYKGWAQYSGETMKSEVKAKGTEDGEAVEMTIATTGKYTGPCK